MKPTAKSLILDLLSTLRHGSMPVRALIEAGELFSVEQNNIRVSLARLRAAGRVERDERGRYRLGPASQAISGHVAGWRRILERVQPWGGRWAAVHVSPRTGGGDRRSRQALGLLGLRPLERGLLVRPDNRSGGIPALRLELRALGLAPDALVFASSDLDEESEARARSLWDVDRLQRSYDEAHRVLAESRARIPRLSVGEAMVETFELGGRVLRQITSDPLLPEPMVPAGAFAALVEDMVEYDRRGRSCWSAFLDRFAVPHLRHPVDLRFGEAADHLSPTSQSHSLSPSSTGETQDETPETNHVHS